MRENRGSGGPTSQIPPVFLRPYGFEKKTLNGRATSTSNDRPKAPPPPHRGMDAHQLKGGRHPNSFGAFSFAGELALKGLVHLEANATGVSGRAKPSDRYGSRGRGGGFFGGLGDEAFI